MKPKKDIFDLFRDNQHKLNERPSHEAWGKLESRLDQHKDRNRSSIYRILSMAAAVVGLVFFVSVISLMLKPNHEKMAVSEIAMDRFSTEELKVITVSNESDGQIAAYHKKYDNHLSSPIMEGKANKKLIARMDPQRRDGNLDSFIKRAKREKEQSFIAAAPSSSLKLQPSPKMESYALETDDILVDTLVQSEIIVENAKDFADEDSALSEMEDDASFEISSNETKKADRYAYEPAAGVANEALEISKEAKTRSSVKIPTVKNTNIEQFQWLTGKWEGNINNQVSVEQWNQIDAQTIEGHGFLIVNGQSTFQENMKIQEKKGIIYFIADLNGTGNPISYELVSNDGFQAVFENQTVDFPNQVVLQRTNSSNFQTIYQNTSPGNIDETQQSYYLNRNYIQKEQVIRNLRRVND